MLLEQKLITVRCDMGDCDLTGKYITEPEFSNSEILFKEGWTTCTPQNQMRYICSDCYQKYLTDENNIIKD